MTVSKPIPCSLYDIQGLQSWLDEMALNGLFFHHLSHFNDQAYFETGEPRPVRYRLDPADKDSRKGKEREEAYAQMGWSYVSRIGKRFYIFSSDDPEAPELYNDSQSLAIAMEKLVNREVKSTIYCALAFVLLILLLLFLGRRSLLPELLLWEDPQLLAILGIAVASILIVIPMILLQIRSQRRLIAALSQGFPPKAGRRWNRPRVLVWYIPFWFLLCVPPPVRPRHEAPGHQPGKRGSLPPLALPGPAGARRRVCLHQQLLVCPGPGIRLSGGLLLRRPLDQRAVYPRPLP